MIFREYEPADLDALVSLEKRAFPIGAYTKSMLRKIFEVKDSFNILVEEQKKVIAYVIALPLGRDSADIESIAVDPEFQKEGLGTKLMKEIEYTMVMKGIKTSFLEVRDKNEEAIAFYRKIGYGIIDHLPTYYHELYGGSQGAYRMKKILRL